METGNYIDDTEYYFLQPGYIYCTTKPTAIATILGSCVSLCLFDRANHFGGMNHYIYPAAKNRLAATASYGDAAILALYRSLLELGAKKNNLSAKIIGGAYLQNNSDSRLISLKNVDMCRRLVQKLNIKIAAQDTGGTEGRKVIYYTHTFKAFVKKIKQVTKVPDIFFVDGPVTTDPDTVWSANETG